MTIARLPGLALVALLITETLPGADPSTALRTSPSAELRTSPSAELRTSPSDMLQAQPSASRLFVSHPAGVYSEDVPLIAQATTEGIAVLYRFRNHESWGPLMALREPILLEAAEGEQRQYDIGFSLRQGDAVLEERVFSYRIDKRRPLPPGLEILEDFSPQGVILRFLSAKGERVVFRSLRDAEGPLAGIPVETVWDGNPLVLEAEDDEPRETTLVMATVDEAGNRSETRTSSFTLRRIRPELEVLSPVPGRFANHQFLYIRSSGLCWIRYTLDGSDPAEKGKEYIGPTPLAYSGELHLRVAGKPRGRSQELLNREVRFQVEPEEQPSIVSDTDSGIYTRGLKMQMTTAAGMKGFYALGEHVPEEYDLPLPRVLSLEAVPSALKAAVLRVRAQVPDGTWGGEHRFFFILDRRKPQAPAISLQGKDGSSIAPGKSLSGPVQVVINASEEARIVYTLDGGAPARESTTYLGPFAVSPKSHGKDTLTVRAAAVSLAGTLSEPASLNLAFDTEPPSPPAGLEPEGKPVNRSVAINLRTKGNDATLYELAADGSEPGPITAFSARAGDELKLSLPWGEDRTFRVRLGSMDEAGNIAEGSQLYSVRIDKQPPECPKLNPGPETGPFDRNLEVVIETPVRVYYELTDDGATPPDPTRKSPVYRDRLILVGRRGELIQDKLKLVCEDETGNLSDAYGPFVYSLDLRYPRIPELAPAREETAGPRIYNTREVTFEFTDPSFVIFYTCSSDGREPPDPDLRSSRITGNRLQFRGEEDRETSFWIKLLPVSTNLERSGEISSRKFVIDLKPPEAPQFSGFTEGQRYNRPVTLALHPAGQGDVLYVYSADNPEDLKDPVAYGEVYRAPLVFDVEDGKERNVHIRVAVVDRAGNRGFGDAYGSFTLDRKPPPDPQTIVKPDTALSREPLAVILQSGEGRILYEMTSDGSMPPLPGAGSSEYRSPLVLVGKPGQEVSYKIRSVSVDPLGNASPGRNVLSLIIDRLVPPASQPPVIEPLGEGRRFLVSFSGSKIEPLFYRLAAARDSSGFQEYQGPFIYSPEEGAPPQKIECYNQDAAGNRSLAVFFDLPAVGAALPPPTCQGLADGPKLFNRGLDLLFSAPNGTARYEISADGSRPPPVGPSSAIAEGPIKLSSDEGETLHFQVRARSFGSSPLERPSAELSLEATIDRTAPSLPTVDGATDGASFPEDRRLSLLSADGRILYSLAQAEQRPELPAFERFAPYSGEILLSAQPGESRTYWLAAVTMDEAGNRSRETLFWSITINKRALYVSPAGNDGYDGSLTRPLKTLTKAVARALATGRGVLRLARGEYPLDRPLRIETALSLEGGFDPDSWRREGFDRRSSLLPSGDFPGRGSLIEVRGAGLESEGLELRDPEDRCSSLLLLQSGKVSLRDTSLELRSRKGGIGLRLITGEARLQGCQLVAEDSERATLIQAEGGSLFLTGCDAIGPRQGLSFTALSLKAAASRLSGLNVQPGRAGQVMGIRIEGGESELQGCRIASGAGDQNAVALEARDARIRLIDCLMEGGKQGAYSTVLLAEGGSVTLARSTLKASARYGAAALRLFRCELDVSRCRILGEPNEEYLYLLESSRSRLSVVNTVLRGASSRDSVVAVLIDSEADFLNDTCIGSNGSAVTGGFLLNGKNRLRLVNSILARPGDPRGSAVSWLGEDPGDLTMVANDLDGWELLLSGRLPQTPAEAAAVRSAGEPMVSVSAIPVLNALDGDLYGGRFHENLSEPFSRTFRDPQRDDWHLALESSCINAGMDLRRPPFSGPAEDMDGQARPAPFVGVIPAFDIGADEAY